MDLSCYPESSGSCDCKSSYIKHDFKLGTTQDRVLKTEKKTLARNSRKLKTMRTVRTQKLFNSKKVSKNEVAKVFEGIIRYTQIPYIVYLNPYFLITTLEL